MAAATAPPEDQIQFTSEAPTDGLPAAQERAPEAAQPSPTAGAEEAERRDEDVLESIQPSAEPKERRIVAEDGRVLKVYVQKPLTYFRKMQFFRLLATSLKKALNEGGVDAVADVIGAWSGTSTRDFQSLGSSDFEDAGQFMRFVASMVEVAPDILEDAYVLWLAVPPGAQREWAKAAWRGDIEGVRPLSDEEGLDILKTFIVQNWGAMQDFFRVGLRSVVDEARTEQRRMSDREES